jgi:Ala-tRNA(Pro) deacylase
MKLQPYLDRMGIHYQMLRHETVYSAQGLAQAEHVSGHQVIKPVLVRADGQFVLCAVPASSRIDMGELRRQLGAEEMTLADEQAMARVFEDCELGAEPPIGAIFGLPTVMDDSLSDQAQVTFQSGSHREAITIALADYRRIAQPGIAHFARQSNA